MRLKKLRIVAVPLVAGLLGYALLHVWLVQRRDEEQAALRERALLPWFIEEAAADGGPAVSQVDLAEFLAGGGRPLVLQSTGRIAAAPDDLDGAQDYRHQWPGVYFEARFTGERVVVSFADPHNRYRVSIDPPSGASILVNRPGNASFEISALPPGPHEVRVDKISEAQSHIGTFRGLYVDSSEALLPPPPERSRRIEFIGDSDTVGYGNLSGKRDCSGEEVFLLTDTQQSFGRLVARHFSADYVLNAISGIGLVRNDQGSDPERTLTAVYGRTLIDDDSIPRPPSWDPDLVVVAIGSNDFSTQLNSWERWQSVSSLREDFEQSYVRLVQQIREASPHAQVLLLAWEEYGPDYMSAHQHVLTDLQSEGEMQLSLLVLPKMEKTSCHWHPNLADHAAIADSVIHHVEERLEQWSDRTGTP